MRGFIANTDGGWFRLLRDLQDRGEAPEEVNFWRPSETTFRALQPGEPFFFRLKAPDNAIGGFGICERFSVLPVWLAWDAFGEANGVGSLAEFEDRLRRIRQRNRIEIRGELRIGCILLSQPVFFERDEWVRLPSDWGPRTQFGKGYDLGAGEGARVWRECLERLSIRGAETLVAREAMEPTDRYGSPMLVKPRLGQGGFRIAVLEAYERACAVTTEHSLPVLEAAHIRPFADEGLHDVRNGLLLRTDIHRLFDRGYVTVTPDHQFRVSERLREDYANGQTYYGLDGQEVWVPRAEGEKPSRDLLAWHGEEVFRD